MNKKITNSAACANSCAAMEAGGHFKNGAKSKSLMSRGNLLIICAMALLFCGGVSKAVGQSWDIGHNPVQGGHYLSNVTATLNGNTLTINGSGNMADFWCTGANQYDAGGEAPWWFNPAHRNAIHTIVFQTGSNVQNIGMRAFKECSNLQTIIIPSSVTKINGQAFYGCSSLHTVELVNGSSPLQFVGYQVSNPCTGTNINTYDWFDGCTSPLTLYLGREINNWGTSSANQPFYHLKNTLTTLIIGETVNEIGVEAFKDCESLKTVDIKEKCTGTLNFVKYYFGDGGH
ncbi:MAG: leucine-rich repeat domain-containing protein, partial [Lentimicrobiaceae bacterium]|nr:leucine-rich repeat domain-containing protein [Lentimicrobiaceae bacterium]